jgi:hypothetical protein
VRAPDPRLPGWDRRRGDRPRSFQALGGRHLAPRLEPDRAGVVRGRRRPGQALTVNHSPGDAGAQMVGELAPIGACSSHQASSAQLILPQPLLDQGRQLCRPALGRAGDVEPLARLHLRHEQEHHDCGQTLAAAPRPIRRTPEASDLCGLPAVRGAQTIPTRSDGPLGRGTKRSGPKRCSGKVLGLIRLRP